MKFLKAGSSATEAIEASLRILEDKEITNAGYGSNLSIDGTVECDATIVDHLGRSGACGAVPSSLSPLQNLSLLVLTNITDIRNPISLAKLILDTSKNPLSLRRVPPNALVGEGARAFAEEHGLTTCSNEDMTSKNARDRFFRWQDDLRRDSDKKKNAKKKSDSSQGKLSCVPCQYETAPAEEVRRSFPRDHVAAIMAGTWNEGQPDSPYLSSAGSDPSNSLEPSRNPGYFRAVAASSPPVSRSSVRASPEKSPLYSTVLKKNLKPGPIYSLGSKPQLKRPEINGREPRKDEEKVNRGTKPSTDSHQKYHEHVHDGDGSTSPQSTASANADIDKDTWQRSTQSSRGVKRAASAELANGSKPQARTSPFRAGNGDEDMITDTIGAIAVDEDGHIAAGSSSGGIGMKHRGRLGPAALVGVGTAIVPCDKDDEDQISVGAVTSGTGEHMATTMASQRCAERIYHGTRRGNGGFNIADDNEDTIMESFIMDDFMNHPGVKNCHSAGAIGVMVVKKCRDGYYLYFAHNTDSFALASMGGSEREPRCTMSRLSEGANIAQGARKVHLE